jgi:hypothetical protein
MTTTIALIGLALYLAAPIGIVWALERDLHRRRQRAALAALLARHRTALEQFLADFGAAMRPAFEALAETIRDVVRWLATTVAEAVEALNESIDQAPDTPPPADVVRGVTIFQRPPVWYCDTHGVAACHYCDTHDLSFSGRPRQVLTTDLRPDRSWPSPLDPEGRTVVGPCGATACATACLAEDVAGAPCSAQRALVELRDARKPR